jgi:6-phosphogluconolactonase (cycloisomerase 2 family)
MTGKLIDAAGRISFSDRSLRASGRGVFMNNFGRRRRAHRLRTIAALALIAIAAGACGHGIFSGSSSSSSSGGGGSGTARSVYVTNFVDRELSALANSNGTLSSPATIAAGAANGPLGLVLTPPGSSTPVALYVANPADNLIHQFTVTSTGNLSALDTIAAGTQPQQVAVTSNASFAYAINAGGSISEYLINSASGVLTANAPSSIVTGLTTPVSAVANSSSFLYVTDPSGGLGLVLTFTIASGGALSFTSSAATGGSNPGQMAIDAVSNGSTWVFVADTVSGVVSVFQVVGSALSPVVTIPTGGAAAGMALATTSGGTFLYVANPSQDLVTTFSLNTATGVLALFATTPGFNLPTGLAVDNSSTTLFVTNNGAGTVTTLTISSTGALSAINSFPTENPTNSGSEPEYIAVTP